MRQPRAAVSVVPVTDVSAPSRLMPVVLTIAQVGVPSATPPVGQFVPVTWFALYGATLYVVGSVSGVGVSVLLYSAILIASGVVPPQFNAIAFLKVSRTVASGRNEAVMAIYCPFPNPLTTSGRRWASTRSVSPVL